MASFRLGAGSLVALLSALQCVQASSTPFEYLPGVPSGWTLKGRPDPAQPIALQIGVKQQNLARFEQTLLQVSDPSHASYGQHWEGDAVADLLRPLGQASASVTQWLKDFNVTEVQDMGSWVNFVTDVGTADKMLDTEFAYYGADNGVEKLRTLQYSVPAGVAKHIDLVAPTIFFDRTSENKIPAHMRNKKPDMDVAEASKSSCEQLITPDCIRQLYNIHYTPDPKSGSRMSFGSFLGESALLKDLESYQKTYNLPRNPFTVETDNGGINNQSFADTGITGEANLDSQLITAVSHPLPVLEYITGGLAPIMTNLDQPTQASASNEPYVPFFTYLLGKKNKNIPQVLSISYGDDEQTVPPSYAKRACSLMAEFGLRGVSVIVSSGDTGKSIPFSIITYMSINLLAPFPEGVGAPCQSNDGKNTTQFTPQFPSTCPYVTSVGGTQAFSPEVAWVASSGGFSNYFDRASYQQGAVQEYFDRHLPKKVFNAFKPYFNPNGRAFPDVAAHSLTPDYAIFLKGKMTMSGGTSAATPVFSSIISLLNDARLRHRQPVMGFLNPWLYSVGKKGLTDITGGGSVGCNRVNGQTGAKIPTGGLVPYASWNATKDWDPVTGLGTPDLVKLLKIFGY
ncbi:MAG: hypothetical protein M4579_005302 [Chaenotheca gracillima]|nr:MAG: hypothetical protein M4579_005302 [Chaenotheca gracillima]